MKAGVIFVTVPNGSTSPQPSFLARSPLFPLYGESSAKTTAFSGWEMPLQFQGIRREHEAVRTGIGVFDISHMGKFLLQGDDILENLQGLVPSDLHRLEPGQAQYTVFLNPSGGIIDDLIVYSQGKNRVFLIVNAATRERDKSWLLQQLGNDKVDLQDLTQSNVLVAVQGPRAEGVLQTFVDTDLSQIPFFGHSEPTLFGTSAFVARTGYTGEDGFEVMVDPEAGRRLWRELLKAGATPCGLGARDTLRLEACLSLYGQDIDTHTTPLEAGLKWLVHLESQGDFIGRSALERQRDEGLTQRLVALKMEGRHIARHGYSVHHNGEVVGRVTSGAPSPTLGYPIALAYVRAELAKVGRTLEVEVRGKLYPAQVVKKPFYRRR
ncbi:glycine cleavage system aminomethyltransferase GcvT [Baaleninema simplex]|uniref:glycine cleavage system aminomethyltransferase GcvT n=1 Tax=Baaleninema simplex TaxID=2862350 RepID=UPI000346BE1C|nr:glycine cleavage system aminomethyltransferase GcvT [Baaleninema simplex]